MKEFGLHLFTTDLEVAKQAERARMSGLIVDWETFGKDGRQKGAGLETNFDSPEDIDRLKGAVSLPVWCRINGFGPHTEREVELAVGAGADLVLLPMVESLEEVDRFLGLLGERCKAGILVETRAAISISKQLAERPLSAVYVGLNDLSLDRETGLFDALVDGTVERVRESFEGVRFGVAGLTRIDGGDPIPARLLVAELSRLQCDFTFLRRAFKADVPPQEFSDCVHSIRSAFQRASSRSATQIMNEHEELRTTIRSAELRLR